MECAKGNPAVGSMCNFHISTVPIMLVLECPMTEAG